MALIMALALTMACGGNNLHDKKTRVDAVHFRKPNIHKSEIRLK